MWFISSRLAYSMPIIKTEYDLIYPYYLITSSTCNNKLLTGFWEDENVKSLWTDRQQATSFEIRLGYFSLGSSISEARKVFVYINDGTDPAWDA